MSYSTKRALLAVFMFAAGALLFAAGRSEAPPPADSISPNYEQTLAMAPAIRHGRLENGLEWFAREHPFPADRVVLRLAVDAGSVLESDEQQGLAHFVEHMAFNGTESFGETELVAYLESLGIRFGPDVNAYTSFDETVYQLEIPAGDQQALETGFQVMREWAQSITFASEAIERERGVIVEEWRSGRGAARRMTEEHLPVLLAGSRYAQRIPIGDMDVVRTAPRSQFIEFYERWYRSDNMAFIVVGDLPLPRMQRLIERYMGAMPAPTSALDRPYFYVEPRPGTRVSIASDPEASQSSVSIYSLREPAPFETVADYRARLTRSIFVSIMNERLRELARDPEGPIVGAGLGFSRFLRSLEFAAATAIPRDERTTEALELLARELERAERFGVQPAEVSRARSRLLESIESARANFASQESAVLADELVRHWLEGEPVPGVEREYELYQQLLPTIGVVEVAEVARQFAGPDGRVVLASLREGSPGSAPTGAPLPSDSALSASIERAVAAELSPPARQQEVTTLLAEQPVAGSAVARVPYEAIDTTGVLLSNGMRLIIRPSDLADDEVLVGAYSPGGLSQLSDELVPAARLATAVAQESGLGSLDAGALERALAGRSANLAMSIGRASEGFSGSARTEDLQLLFEMIHLRLVAPRFSERALANVRQQSLQAIRGRMAAPQGIWQTELQNLFASGDIRLRPSSEAEVEAITLDEVRRVYTERFSDPSDMVVVVVGNVDESEVVALASRYLAGIEGSQGDRSDATDAARSLDSLPTVDGFPPFNEQVADNGYRWPDGVVREVVRAGSEPVAQVAIVIHAPYTWSRRENQLFIAAADLLNIRLREVIREEAGGTYGVGSAAFRYRRPEPHAFTQIFFGMDPARADELTTRAIEVVEELREAPAAATYIERVKAQQTEQFTRGLQENEFWLGNLLFGIEHGRDLNRILEIPELIDSISADELVRVARDYLDPSNRIEVLLLPAE